MLLFGSSAQAVQVSFSAEAYYLLGTYNVSLGGSTISATWEDDKDLYRLTPAGPATVDLEVGVPYTLSATWDEGTTLNSLSIALSESSSCHVLYVNGSASTSFGTSSPAQWTVEVRVAAGTELALAPAQLTADGQSLCMPYLTVPSAATNVQWAIVSADDLDCTLTNIVDPSTGFTNCYIQAGEKEGTITLQATVYPSGCTIVTNLELVTCASCAGGECSAGTVDAELDSVSIKMRLGRADAQKNAGALVVHEELPTAELYTPQCLKYPYVRANVTVKLDGEAIHQLLAPDVFVNVTTNSPCSFSVAFYRTSCVTGVDAGTGFYQFTGTAFSTVQFDNPDGVGSTNRLWVIQTRECYSVTNEYAYTNGTWEVTVAGLKKETLTSTTVNGVRTETREVRQGSGPVVRASARSYLDIAGKPRLIQEITGTGANALTNTYDYYTNGLLRQAVRADGSWEIFVYDEQCRPTNIYSSYLNQAPTTNGSLCRLIERIYSPSLLEDYCFQDSGDDGTLNPSAPRCEIEYLLGHEVARRYFAYRPGEKEEIRSSLANDVYLPPWYLTGFADNLATYTRFLTNGPYYGKPELIARPDGTLELYSYSGTNGYVTNTVWAGAPDMFGTNIIDGTMTVTVTGPFGELLARSVYYLKYDDTNSATENALISRETNGDFDADHRPRQSTYLDGTTNWVEYSCCGIATATNREGTVTTYGYDALKRQITQTTAGIMLSNHLDAAGQVLATYRYGSNGPPILLSQAIYDDAGRRTSSTDALGNTTYYTNYTDAQGFRVQRTTYPDQSERIDQTYQDGHTYSVSGSAAQPVSYEYGLESQSLDRYWEPAMNFYVKEMRGTANEWTKSYTDSLGNTFKTTYAASGTNYPSSQSLRYLLGTCDCSAPLFVNKPWKDVDPDGVTTYYDYDPYTGKLLYRYVDIDGSGSLSGPDRTTEHTSGYRYATEYGCPVRYELTWVYTKTNEATTVLVSSVETSADGLRTWTSHNGLTNFSQTAYAGGGVRLVTNTALDGTYTVSTFKDGRPISFQTLNSQLGTLNAVTYGYDAHQRQVAVTDARTGTTTLGYNAADQVVTNTPPPAMGAQGAQTTVVVYTNVGGADRVWRTLLPDATSVTNEYYPTGLPKRKTGSREYPVEYTYDAAGRMKTLTTWTDYPNAGAATTTWNYDTYRGLLSSKTYTNGTGPAYTYTSAGRLQTRTSERNIVTTYAYDSGGALLSVTYSDGTAGVTNTLDRVGRPVKITAGTNSTSVLLYHDAGLLLSETFTAGPLAGLTVSNQYDGYLRRVTNGVWNGTTWLAQSQYGYDAASRLALVTQPSTLNPQLSVGYSYLANSPLVEYVYFTNGSSRVMTTTKTYDGLNRLTAISSVPSASSAVSFNYAYNLANQRTAITNADSSRWAFAYDPLGQVTSGKKYWEDNSLVAGQQFEYDFDHIGNRNWAKAGGNSSGGDLRQAFYTNNALNQITGRTIPGAVDIIGAATNTATVSVNDQAVSRKGEYYHRALTINNSTGAVWQGVTVAAVKKGATTNDADLMVTNRGSVLLPKTPEAFFHDADGNMTSDGVWTNTWNAENRLICMEGFASMPTSARQKLVFTYDHQGRRISKVVSNWTGSAWTKASEQRFIYDGWNLLAILTPNFQLLSTFTWGLDLSGSLQGAGGVGGLLSVYDSTTINNQPSTHFASFDGNGNVMALVSASDGSLSAQYEYGPFGELIRATGPMASANPFRFSTKYQDDESDLLNYGYRSYNPTTGRWLSRDLVEETGSLSLFGFVGNCPVCYVDLLGLQSWMGPGYGSIPASAGTPQQSGGGLAGPWSMLSYGLIAPPFAVVPVSDSLAQKAKNMSHQKNQAVAILYVKTLLMCGKSGGISLTPPTDKSFSIDSQVGMVNTGNWQLDLVGDCSWSCESATETDCCCKCKIGCKFKGYFSKIWTFQPWGFNNNNIGFWPVWLATLTLQDALYSQSTGAYVLYGSFEDESVLETKRCSSE